MLLCPSLNWEPLFFMCRSQGHSHSFRMTVGLCSFPEGAPGALPGPHLCLASSISSSSVPLQVSSQNLVGGSLSSLNQSFPLKTGARRLYSLFSEMLRELAPQRLVSTCSWRSFPGGPCRGWIRRCELWYDSICEHYSQYCFIL